eukprot:symbB.v1.2.000394.t1/scaffold30.1/size407774/10
MPKARAKRAREEDERHVQLKAWLKELDPKEGLMKYYDALITECDADLTQIAAARIESNPSVSPINQMEPSFWDAINCKKVGDQIKLAKGIIALKTNFITTGCIAMAGKAPKNKIKGRSRKPTRSTGKNNKAIMKKHQKVKKKHEKRKKARFNGKVDELADSFAKIATPAAFTEAASGQADSGMNEDDGKVQEPALSRQELRKRLKAKIAGHELDRTQGLEKGLQDHSGLKKQKRPGNRQKMDVS